MSDLCIAFSAPIIYEHRLKQPGDNHVFHSIHIDGQRHSADIRQIPTTRGRQSGQQRLSRLLERPNCCCESLVRICVCGGTFLCLDVHLDFIDDRHKALLQHSETWDAFEHPHISKFIGTSPIESEPLHVISTNYANGNIRQYLATNPNVERPPLVITFY